VNQPEYKRARGRISQEAKEPGAKKYHGANKPGGKNQRRKSQNLKYQMGEKNIILTKRSDCAHGRPYV